MAFDKQLATQADDFLSSGSIGHEDYHQEQQNLCARCASLDIDRILSKGAPESAFSDGVIFTLGIENQPASVSCAFCQLLAAASPLRYGEGGLALCSLSRRGRVASSRDEGDPVILGVRAEVYLRRNMSAEDIEDTLGETGYICSVHPPTEYSIGARLIEPKSIDYCVLRNWLSICRSHHESHCGNRRSPSVTFLRLIDCETRKIELATGSNVYVALSYVWGNSASRDQSAAEDFSGGGFLPGTLPRTIEDAITVTKELRFRYLWIDRYCIAQGNEAEKHSQIRQMDLIYSNAEVTLVAAAGQDPNFGLPGVSLTPRAHQLRAEVGKHTLAFLWSDPKNIIEKSVWISRAWTYQEALCSRRLIIFTEQQTYYECSVMNLCETINSDNERQLDLGMRWGPRRNMFLKIKVGREPWDVLAKIAEYSARTITFEKDTLDAILGVLRTFEHSKFPIYHYWGVPVLPPYGMDSDRDLHPINRSLAEGFLAGLCWQPMSSGRRRPEFPSWSWTGWSCLVHRSSKEYDVGLRLGPDLPIELSVQLDDGRRLRWETMWNGFRQHEQGFGDLARRICIDAWTIDIKIKFFSAEDKVLPRRMSGLPASNWAFFEDQGNNVAYSRGWLLQEAEEGSDFPSSLQNQSCVGIILGGTKNHGRDKHNKLKVFVLVVKDVGGEYERVGHLDLSPTSLTVIVNPFDGTYTTTHCFHLWLSRKKRQTLTIR